MRHRKILVMGVSGCGKSTLAAALAKALGATLLEGDEYHLPESQAKMRNGIALNDGDREPWLNRLGKLLAECSGDAVLTCSALKHRYRERLRQCEPALRIVFLEITPAAAQARVASRSNHLFPAGLVASQFEALEPPLNEPGVLRVNAESDLATQIRAALEWLED
jgi:gluconokinase